MLMQGRPGLLLQLQHFKDVHAESWRPLYYDQRPPPHRWTDLPAALQRMPFKFRRRPPRHPPCRGRRGGASIHHALLHLAAPITTLLGVRRRPPRHPPGGGGRCSRSIHHALLLHLPIGTLLLLLVVVAPSAAQDSNHYFCGTSWGDASDNCDERQHCPSGTDDECETDGHICFGGTTCDVKLGHGNKAKYANVAYGDISNTRFCGMGWDEANEGCSLETHCPSGFSEECPDGQSCYGGLQCNVQDLLEEMGGDEGGAAANAIGKHDPRRKNFCGTSWGDANAKCDIWCAEGDDTDCPGGLGCFGNTECFYDEDLVPTQSPIIPPTPAPSTVPPVSYKDPGNTRYCGVSWALARQNCSVETHCPSGSDKDCPKGQTCHGGLMECNIQDLLKEAAKPEVPTYVPTPAPISSDDPSNTKFCGKSWMEAEDNCSIETHCPLDECPTGFVCYGGTRCNAATMTEAPTHSKAPTIAPSANPTTSTLAPITPAPTISPPPTNTPKPSPAPTIPADDPRNSYWCGTDWGDAVENCHEPCISGQDTECPPGMACIAFTPCRPKPKPTPPPTKTPTTSDPTLPPSPPPSPSPVTDVTNAPSGKPIESSMAPAEGLAATIRPTEIATEYDTMGKEETAVEDIDEGDWTDSTPAPATPPPSGKPTPRPSRSPTKKPTNPPLAALPPSTVSKEAPSHDLIAAVGSVLVEAGPTIGRDVLLTINMLTSEVSPTQLYQYDGFVNALGVLSKGDMGSSYFYLGPNNNPNGVDYGLANVAIFLAEATIETVQFGLCDEVSWEKDVFSRYPISNSCGQGRFAGATLVPYEDSNPCPEDELHMACPIDNAMSAVAESHGIFVGAPPPLECRPNHDGGGTGGWDPSLSCKGDGCSAYDGQRMGSIDLGSIPAANSFGRTDVEGCCWWGRGAFPRGSAGTCLVGKMNYYLGRRALVEGRSTARFKDVDFCKDPGAICRGFYHDDKANAEIRWLMGLLFWINKVQTYNANGWSYLEGLHAFVEGRMSDTQFLEDVSRIVTRGCHHQSSCGNAVESAARQAKFDEIIDIFGRAQAGTLEVVEEEEEEEVIASTLQPSKRPTPAPAPRPSLGDLIPQPNSIPTGRPTLRAGNGAVADAQSSLAPVDASSNVAETVVAEDDYELTAEELTQRLNYPNFYCASSADEAQTKCATTLRTCNFGDLPCKPGLYCFGEFVCSIDWSDIDFNAEEESPPVIEPPEETPVEDDSSSNAMLCNGLCLRPLSVEECTAAGDAMSAIVSCEFVGVGEVCENYVYCSDQAFHSNCPGGHNAFMRVLAEKCGVLSTDQPSTVNATPPSLKPSLAAGGYGWNSTAADSDPSFGATDEYPEFTGVAEETDEESGAWWKWYEGNDANRPRILLVLPLLSVAVAWH